MAYNVQYLASDGITYGIDVDMVDKQTSKRYAGSWEVAIVHGGQVIASARHAHWGISDAQIAGMDIVDSKIAPAPTGARRVWLGPTRDLAVCIAQEQDWRDAAEALALQKLRSYGREADAYRIVGTEPLDIRVLPGEHYAICVQAVNTPESKRERLTVSIMAAHT